MNLILILLVAISFEAVHGGARAPARPVEAFFPSRASMPVLGAEVTSSSLWPAPVYSSAANVKWTSVSKMGEAAVGPDCPFSAHGPGGSLSECQRSCASAGPGGCTDINWNADIGDCVFRRCSDPMRPALSPAPNYTVFAVAYPAVATLSLDPSSFSFAVSGATNDVLVAALARAPASIFMYPNASKPTKGKSVLSVLDVRVASPDTTLSLNTDESYSINVSSSGEAVITASTVFGALHGLETFSQLVAFNFSSNVYQVDVVSIYDAPRFPYRGVMLDTSRHFLAVSQLKKIVDELAAVKLNVLSLHLTDDQSWPVFVPQAPELTLQGAFSNYSHTYSEEDLSGLARYALMRGVRVVPEIDTPSHFGVLSQAYPQFTANTSSGDSCMVDPSREETFDFLETVLASVAGSFSDALFRIGGDEFQGCWNDCPAVKAWIANTWGANGTIYDAYHYFERRVIGIARKLRKSVMAWQDIHGWPRTNETWAADYADTTLNVWSGCYQGNWQDDVAAYTAEGGAVVVSGPFYITNEQPGAPHFDWRQMYATDLWNFTGSGNASRRALVRGAELCVWDDAAGTDSADVSMQISPYIFGISEALWSPHNATSGIAADEMRAHHHRCRLVARGYDSHPIIGFGAYCPKESEWLRVPTGY